jgi:hypothetical protein
MPQEPKYQLNKTDADRWYKLLTRHCMENPTHPGGVVQINAVYPPLTLKETVEFERLCKKRSRKIASHPKVAEEIRQQKKTLRRAEHLRKILLRLTNSLNH